MKAVCYSLIALLFVTTATSAFPVSAQEAVMTEEHITRIKDNCQQSRAILSQVRTNDALTFINRNQAYFSIGDKLMARLNSRLALGRHDVTQLVKTTSDYTSALTKFRDTYKVYADQMSELVKMDCRKQPVEFYDRVADAREQRQKVHDAVNQLKRLIIEYEDAVIGFKAKYFGQQGVSRD